MSKNFFLVTLSRIQKSGALFDINNPGFVNLLVIAKTVLKGILKNYIHSSEIQIHQLKPFSFYYKKSIFFQNDPIRLEDGQWACPYCPRTMKAPSNIRLHMLTHTGEKPFACTFCSYASNKKGNLQSHLKLRHGTNL